MSLDSSAVPLGVAEPWAAVPCAHAHDQTQAQMQPAMHDECAEQGIRQASSYLESPQEHEHEHTKTPSNYLGAGSAPPHKAPQDVVDAPSHAAAGVTSKAQDPTPIPMSAPPTMNQGDNPNRGKTFQLQYLEAHVVASQVQTPKTLILCHSRTTICSRGSRTTAAS